MKDQSKGALKAYKDRVGITATVFCIKQQKRSIASLGFSPYAQDLRGEPLTPSP